jgi:hypothetical protein
VTASDSGRLGDPLGDRAGDLEAAASFWFEVAKQNGVSPPPQVTDADVGAFLFALEVGLGQRKAPIAADDAKLLGKAAGRVREMWKAWQRSQRGSSS